MGVLYSKPSFTISICHGERRVGLYRFTRRGLACVAYAEGDYINLNGKKYTICDPTYIGAPIGATMPDMDNKTAKVIKLH